jgi:glycopeptide antibiotics resistance protein
VGRGKWPFVLWTAVIIVAVVPWASYQNHSHWSRVAWLPFISSEVKIRDIVVNLLLYAPWGYFWARAWPDTARRLWVVVALASALSITTELSQVYSHGRFPSATDVTCNVLGAIAGAEFARRAFRN